MNLDAAVVRQIDRRGRGADIDGGQPASIAVGQDIDALACFFARGDGGNERQPVAADRRIDSGRGFARKSAATLTSRRTSTRSIFERRAHAMRA